MADAARPRGTCLQAGVQALACPGSKFIVECCVQAFYSGACSRQYLLQPEDDNHETAMQYCLQNLDRHRFGDVNPKAVEADYSK